MFLVMCVLLARQFPELKETSYSTHHFMSSDWLNEVWCARDDVMDDYRFVYMGPAGTWLGSILLPFSSSP